MHQGLCRERRGGLLGHLGHQGMRRGLCREMQEGLLGRLGHQELHRGLGLNLRRAKCLGCCLGKHWMGYPPGPGDVPLPELEPGDVLPPGLARHAADTAQQCSKPQHTRSSCHSRQGHT